MRSGRTTAEVRRRLAAAPETVFAAFADPGLVCRWLSPSPDIVLTFPEFDFRIGGAYRLAYHLPGGRTMVVNGVYEAITPPSRIVFSWNVEPPDEHAGLRSRVTVTIAADGGGTALRIRHERLTLPGARERHALGWRGALEQLAAWVAASEVSRGR